MRGGGQPVERRAHAGAGRDQTDVRRTAPPEQSIGNSKEITTAAPESNK